MQKQNAEGKIRDRNLSGAAASRPDCSPKVCLLPWPSAPLPLVPETLALSLPAPEARRWSLGVLRSLAAPNWHHVSAGLPGADGPRPEWATPAAPN